MPRRTRQENREPRGRTGLRNRKMKRPGSYALKRKGRAAEYYGTWKDGKRLD